MLHHKVEMLLEFSTGTLTSCTNYFKDNFLKSFVLNTKCNPSFGTIGSDITNNTKPESFVVVRDDTAS